MKRVTATGAACLLAALLAGCVEPPVTPIPEAALRSARTVSLDVSGMKDSDTSKLAARGGDEGSKLGAQQGYATVVRNGGASLLGLLVLGPIGAAVGSATGRSEARSMEVVDEARTNLRLAIQETDFTELLRRRLAPAKVGRFDIQSASSGAGSAAATTAAGAPVDHIIALEYHLNVYGQHPVNPDIGVYAIVHAQVQSSDRKQVIHRATWVFCGKRSNFVQMASDNAAAFRAQINEAAEVLGEAIPYDLYVSKQPRTLKVEHVCMDYSDLPSRTGQAPPVVPAPPSAQEAVASPPMARQPTPAPTPSAGAQFDGRYSGGLEAAIFAMSGFGRGSESMRRVQVRVTNGEGTGEVQAPRCAPGTVTLKVSPSGAVSGEMNVLAPYSCAPAMVRLSGTAEGDLLKLTATDSSNSAEFSLRRTDSVE